MNRFKLTRLILAAAAVLGGSLYLVIGETMLGAALAILCLAFWGIAIVSLCESRAQGATGFIATLPAIAAMMVAVFASIGALAYLLQ